MSLVSDAAIHAAAVAIREDWRARHCLMVDTLPTIDIDSEELDELLAMARSAHDAIILAYHKANFNIVASNIDSDI